MNTKIITNSHLFLATIMVFLLGVTSCKQEVSSATKQVNDTTKTVVESAKNQASQTKDAMTDKAMEAKEKMTEKAMDAKEAMDDVVENTKDKMEAVKDKMEEMPEKMTKVASSSKMAATDGMDKMEKEAAKNTRIGEYKAEEKSTVAEAKSKVTQVVEAEKPALEAKKEMPTEIEEVPVRTQKKKKPAPVAAGPNHKIFDDILRANVSSSGKVNYAAIKSDKAKLEGYLRELAGTNIKGLNRNEQLAYWINAYNAFTIKKIIDNYPVASITDLNGGKPWDIKDIKLDGAVYSLNNIENDIIRPQFKEPRIHFAVNCAAKSCPPLLNRAWTASNLESNFEKQAKSFINDPSQNSISSGSAQVSKIFEWYGVDFGDLKTYLNKYAKTKIGSDVTIGFKDYDWSLNN